jgi:hypothetical protein
MIVSALMVLVQYGEASPQTIDIKWTAPAGFTSRNDDFYELGAGLADMNGDGEADLIVSQHYGGWPPDSTVFLVYTTGLGGLTLGWHHSVPGQAGFNGFADIDADGQKDAILNVGEDPDYAVQIVAWPSGLVKATIPGLWQGIIDLDHDGYPDLLVDDTTLEVWGRKTVDVVSEESGGGIQPQNFRLAQNVPNPFNSATAIPYEVRHASRVKLAIYNSVGQRVRCLVDAERPAGSYREEWDGRDDDGRTAASGVYFYQLTESGQTAAKKMVLLK